LSLQNKKMVVKETVERCEQAKEKRKQACGE
jgi:hypothetical protein